MRDMMHIVETDENGNNGYQISCEWAKALQRGQSALQTDGLKQVAFYRFNTNAYKILCKAVCVSFEKRCYALKALME